MPGRPTSSSGVPCSSNDNQQPELAKRSCIGRLATLTLLAFAAACSGDAFPTSPAPAADFDVFDNPPAQGETPGTSTSAEDRSDPTDNLDELQRIEEIAGRIVAIGLPERLQATEGATQRISATFRLETGEAMPAEKLRWSSADPKVATVDAEGLLTAWSAGSTKIFAAALGKHSIIDVQVRSSSVATIELNATSLHLAPGETFQLRADLSDRSGNRLSKKTNWSSSDPVVADVNNDGLVTAHSVGAATILARSGGANAAAQVTVVESSDNPAPPPPDRVSGLAVSSVSEQAVSLRFTQVDDGTGSPADYVVRFSPPSIDWSKAADVAKGSCSGPITGTSVGSSLTCTVEGLQASTDYDFQVAAFRGSLDADAVFGICRTWRRPRPRTLPCSSMSLRRRRSSRRTRRSSSTPRSGIPTATRCLAIQ